MMSSEHHFIRAAPIDRRARRALKIYGLIAVLGLTSLMILGAVFG